MNRLLVMRARPGNGTSYSRRLAQLFSDAFQEIIVRAGRALGYTRKGPEALPIRPSP